LTRKFIDLSELEAKSNELLANIQARLPELECLLEEMSSDYEYEDTVYRFYHQSWKVYERQELTKSIEKSKKPAPRAKRGEHHAHGRSAG